MKHGQITDGVDVIFPCLDEAAALPVVLGALPEGFRAIVVDNGSTDDSAHIAAAHGAKVVPEPRRGYGAAVHTGLEFASADGLSERLACAHADAATMLGLPVLQIGMDTPQVTTLLLAEAAAELLTAGRDAVLGPAEDGGWWALGLRDPYAAKALSSVPMSRSDTGSRTLAALTNAGLRTTRLRLLSDVDTMADARRVARLVGGRFAEAVAAVPS